MAELETQQTGDDVNTFLASIEPRNGKTANDMILTLNENYLGLI